MQGSYDPCFFLRNFFFSFSSGSKVHSAAAADRALVKLYILSSMYMFSYQYHVCNVS